MHRTTISVATLFFLLTVLFSSVYPFSTKKLFEETVYNIKAMAFVNDDVGWAVGDVHWDQTHKTYVTTILKTIDAGGHWVEQNSGSNQSLLGVSFVDALHGWACGENGTILATLDGGSTWTKKAIATQQELNGLSFADPLHGWVVADSVTHMDFVNAPDGWKGSVWYTNNGGESWAMQTMPGNTDLLHTVKCTDSLNAWAVGNDSLGKNVFDSDSTKAAIYHTTDGGKTWILQFDSNLDIGFTNIAFSNGNRGCVVGFGVIFYTNDSGKTWQQATGANATFRDVQFSDTLHAYAVGYDYAGAQGPPVYRSQDGGISWTKGIMAHFQNVDGNNSGLFAVSNSPRRVLALGDDGFQCCSKAPWTGYYYGNDTSFVQKYICQAYRFSDIYFTDLKNGWAVGKYDMEPDYWGQLIFHTQDGGTTWNMQFQTCDSTAKFSGNRTNRIWFTDSLHGCAVGNDNQYLKGCILRTIDGGNHWDTAGSNLHAYWGLEFYGLQFLNERNGWALSGGNFPSGTIQLIHTLDGGATWNWIDTKIDTTSNIGVGSMDINGAVFFTDSLHGWACGGLGIIIHTSDGGTTWSKQNSPSSFGHLASVAFVDTSIGWLGGEGELCYTTNGGGLWQKKDIGNTPIGDITAIQFINSTKGWLCGSNGIIMHTVDGGQTWQAQQNPLTTLADLRSIHFINDTSGWACGSNGTILRITNINEAPTKISKIGGLDQIKSSISFEGAGNRLMAIRITLLNSEPVTANIYDLSGRKIQMLCNSILGTGTHRIAMNGARLPPGAFFISVQAGNLKEIRKYINSR